jgi:hypothetical protein
MIVSSAGHWTVGTFSGLKNDSMPFGGIDNVLTFFKHAMPVWTRMVQGWIRGAEHAADRNEGGGAVTKGGRRRQVIVRAYLPGHDNCHNIFTPWTYYEQEHNNLPYNWGQIKDFNRIFEVRVQFPHTTSVLIAMTAHRAFCPRLSIKTSISSPSTDRLSSVPTHTLEEIVYIS